MADNLSVTQGSGTTIATDDVSGVHYQLIKVAWGAPDRIAMGIIRQPINMITSGDNILIPVNTGYKIILTSLFLLSKGTVDIRFKDGAGSNWLSGPIGLIANTGFVLPEATKGWMESAVNSQLTLNLSAGIQISGHCSYMREV